MTARKIAYFLLAVLALGVVATLVYFYRNVNPVDAPLFPQCAFYRVTGYLCPGCGSQRSIHFFLNGEFAQSFRMNPLLWFGMVYSLAVILLKLPGLRERYAGIRECLTGLWASLSWFVAIILFWILRNVL